MGWLLVELSIHSGGIAKLDPVTACAAWLTPVIFTEARMQFELYDKVKLQELVRYRDVCLLTSSETAARGY